MKDELKEELLKNINLIKNDEEISSILTRYNELKKVITSPKYSEYRKNIEEMKYKNSETYFKMLNEYHSDINVKEYNEIKLLLKEKLSEIKTLIEDEIKL